MGQLTLLQSDGGPVGGRAKKTTFTRYSLDVSYCLSSMLPCTQVGQHCPFLGLGGLTCSQSSGGQFT